MVLTMWEIKFVFEQEEAERSEELRFKLLTFKCIDTNVCCQTLFHTENKLLRPMCPLVAPCAIPPPTPPRNNIIIASLVM